MIRYKYTDHAAGKEYSLLQDDNKGLAGYYLSDSAGQKILFCAPSGHWFEWKAELQAWKKEQEWCRVYYDSGKKMLKIQAPEGFPSPDLAVRAEAEIMKERAESLRLWHSRYDFEGSYGDVVFSRDGSCEIRKIFADTEPIWDIVVQQSYIWKLDAENTKRLLLLTGFDAIGINDLNTVKRRAAFLKRLDELEEKYESYSELFKRLGISFTFDRE